jgi:hypothetical protein
VRLSLFGRIINTQLLSRKIKTMQCSSCWKWHNSRSCARQPRCRLCGSTEHSEKGHSNHCSAQAPHICPPRCLHCHGPHPADYERCLLRPNKKVARCTKAQQAEIRKISSLSLAKARLESKCCMHTTKAPKNQAISTNNTTTSSFSRTNTPPPQAPADSPPVTTRAVRFARPELQNGFDILMYES